MPLVILGLIAIGGALVLLIGSYGPKVRASWHDGNATTRGRTLNNRFRRTADGKVIFLFDGNSQSAHVAPDENGSDEGAGGNPDGSGGSDGSDGSGENK